MPGMKTRTSLIQNLILKYQITQFYHCKIEHTQINSYKYNHTTPTQLKYLNKPHSDFLEYHNNTDCKVTIHPETSRG